MQRLAGIEKISVDAQLTMRAEVRTQRITRTQEWLECSPDSIHHAPRRTVVKLRLMPGHETPQAEDKLLDRAAALGETTLSNLVRPGPLVRAAQTRPHRHDGLAPTASTTACINERYPARKRRDTESSGTPAMLA